MQMATRSACCWLVHRAASRNICAISLYFILSMANGRVGLQVVCVEQFLHAALGRGSGTAAPGCRPGRKRKNYGGWSGEFLSQSGFLIAFGWAIGYFIIHQLLELMGGTTSCCERQPFSSL
jgi:hypothetical protein